MMPLWMEAVVAVLLVLSSVFALIGAIGLLRMKDFFNACTHRHWLRH